MRSRMTGLTPALTHIDIHEAEDEYNMDGGGLYFSSTPGYASHGSKFFNNSIEKATLADFCTGLTPGMTPIASGRSNRTPRSHMNTIDNSGMLLSCLSGISNSSSPQQISPSVFSPRPCGLNNQGRSGDRAEINSLSLDDSCHAALIPSAHRHRTQNRLDSEERGNYNNISSTSSSYLGNEDDISLTVSPEKQPKLLFSTSKVNLFRLTML